MDTIEVRGRNVLYEITPGKGENRTATAVCPYSGCSHMPLIGNGKSDNAAKNSLKAELNNHMASCSSKPSN